MLNNKMITLILFVLFLPLCIYGIGFFLSEKYCVGNICFKKPPYYRFKLFVGNGNKVTPFCLLSLSCKNSFLFKEDSYFTTIFFNNIYGDTLGLVFDPLEKEKKDRMYSTIRALGQCELIKPKNLNIKYTSNQSYLFLPKKNLTIYLSSNNKQTINFMIDELCGKKE
jgi:hypothetical protein